MVRRQGHRESMRPFTDSYYSAYFKRTSDRIERAERRATGKRESVGQANVRQWRSLDWFLRFDSNEPAAPLQVRHARLYPNKASRADRPSSIQEYIFHRTLPADVSHPPDVRRQELTVMFREIPSSVVVNQPSIAITVYILAVRSSNGEPISTSVK